jgi:DNA polymerase-3 subunit alpha
VFEALIKAGACDSLMAPGRSTHHGRAQLFASIDAACEHGSRTQRDKDLGQGGLFGGPPDDPASVLPMAVPGPPPWTEIEQLQHEKDALGLYWSGHPIDRYADALRRFGARTTADLNIKKEDADPERGFGPQTKKTADDISIGGIVGGLRPLKTRKGDRMCVFMLEDATGSIEVVAFPEPFRQYGHLAEAGQMVLVKGRFERDEESARILAAEIQPISVVPETLASSVNIRLSVPPHGRDTIARLWDVLMQHKGDRPVAIQLQETTRKIRVNIDVNAQIRVRPSERLVSEVEKILGAGSVSLR